MPPADPAEDLALASRCAAGEAEAWQTLLDLMGPRIQGIARAILKTPDDALVEDAVSEVFAHFLANDRRVLRLYQGRASLQTYLSVVSERYLWARAKWRSESSRWGEALGEAASRPATGDLGEVLHRERLGLLAQALEYLPPRDRSLLDLLYRQGLTHREAAQRLKVPIGTVSTWAVSAYDKLSKIMNDPSSIHRSDPSKVKEGDGPRRDDVLPA